MHSLCMLFPPTFCFICRPCSRLCMFVAAYCVRLHCAAARLCGKHSSLASKGAHLVLSFCRTATKEVTGRSRKLSCPESACSFECRYGRRKYKVGHGRISAAAIKRVISVAAVILFRHRARLKLDFGIFDSEWLFENSTGESYTIGPLP